MKKRILAALLACAMVLGVTACGSTKTETAETNAATEEAATEEAATEEVAAEEGEKHSAGFIVQGLGNEFFQAFYDTFEATFQANGWDATSSNGDGDVATQIEQIENYTSMGVDVLVIWPVEGVAVDDAVKQAMDNGVKVMEMINVGTNYDVQLVSDDAKMMEYANIMAAQWVDEYFPDAADGEVKCVVIDQMINETNKQQAEVALRISEYNSKIEVIGEYTVQEETQEAGVSAAEDIFNMYPEVNLILSPQGTVMLGVNQYLTSISSPVTDYSELGIFTINGSGDQLYEAVAKSATDEAPLRGALIASGVQRSIDDIYTLAEQLVNGELETPYTFVPPNLIIDKDTVAEMVETGDVTSKSVSELEEWPVSFY